MQFNALNLNDIIIHPTIFEAVYLSHCTLAVCSLDSFRNASQFGSE